jgi:hypothetical protein
LLDKKFAEGSSINEALEGLWGIEAQKFCGVGVVAGGSPHIDRSITSCDDNDRKSGYRTHNCHIVTGVSGAVSCHGNY